MEKGLIYEVERVRVHIPNRSYKDTHGVSLCCIILNEEKEIQEFLSYHKPYFKEVIMIDLGSTDKTIELATPFVDSIFTYKQDGHHSNAINRMMEKVNNDWTFLVDCDERLEMGILNNLNNLINQEEYDCYSFPRKNLIDGVLDSLRPIDYQDRLFRSYCRMIRPIHQEIVGCKKVKKIPQEDGNYIIHAKTSQRHNTRNAGYALYEYKFKHEMGGPGEQLEDSFNKRYPNLNWESIYETYNIGKKPK